MGQTITLHTSDGHQLSAYRADPAGKPRGGVLVIQEVFGVNPHIRAVADGYAADGYVAIAPAVFDRVERGVELDYAGTLPQGLGIVQKLKPEESGRDLQAALDELAKVGKVGVVGYCWGGTMAWFAASKLNHVAAASCYYGGYIAQKLDMKPRVPTILHVGSNDPMISAEAVEKTRAAAPDVHYYVYEGASHAFNCEDAARGTHNAPAAKLARERTIELFHKYVG